MGGNIPYTLIKIALKPQNAHQRCINNHIKVTKVDRRYEFKGSGGALITKLDFGEYLLRKKTIFTLKTVANVDVVARTVRQDPHSTISSMTTSSS